MLGPYVLTDLADLLIGVPVPARADLPEFDEADRDWETSPEGRYVIAEQDATTRVCVLVVTARCCCRTDRAPRHRGAT
jgi:hypothetical protein